MTSRQWNTCQPLENCKFDTKVQVSCRTHGLTSAYFWGIPCRKMYMLSFASAASEDILRYFRGAHFSRKTSWRSRKKPTPPLARKTRFRAGAPHSYSWVWELMSFQLYVGFNTTRLLSFSLSLSFSTNLSLSLSHTLSISVFLSFSLFKFKRSYFKAVTSIWENQNELYFKFTTHISCTIRTWAYCFMCTI